ncbi:heme-binding protein [Opitutales bacterium]|nr:heme-binding protein [Opitutales bacterium]
MRISFLFTYLAILASLPLMGYEAMHEKTPVGEIKVLELPKRIALEAKSPQGYFSENNGLFRTLFGYISKHDLSMTTPVEAEIEPGKMRFFVGEKDAAKKRPNTGNVVVINLDPITVVAIGIRGSYNSENFQKNEKLLLEWIDENPDYETSGTAYAVYWDGPFIPWLLKRSEVHLPIRYSQKESEKNQPSKKQ